MRLVALTAAAMLGTGCFVSTTNDGFVDGFGDVNVFWEFMRNAPAANPDGFVIYDASLEAISAQGICPESDVDTVRVESAAGVVDVACTGPIGRGFYSQGITIFDLRAGSNTITVRGYRGGFEVYRSSVLVTVQAGRRIDRIVTVVGVSAPLDLFAKLWSNPTPVAYLDCAEALFPDITYELRDSFSTVVERRTVGCEGDLPLAVFIGDADLDNYTVRMQGFRSSTAVVLDSCRVDFDHFGSQTGVVVADLFANPVPVCP